MKTSTYILALSALLYLCGCARVEMSGVVYESEALRITQLTPNTYIHTSFLQLANGAFFPCNGLIYTNEGEAVVFDTPTTDSVSAELIGWAEENDHAIRSVVVNHFHVDCLGGLAAFHRAGIPSYANGLTADLAAESRSAIPQNVFDGQFIMPIGDERIINRFFGRAHSHDNIVSYLPGEGVLYGGCMIKEIGAGKGNLADADTLQWPLTVESIKEHFTDVQWVVPGHGKAGGAELLDYTIELFEGQ